MMALGCCMLNFEEIMKKQSGFTLIELVVVVVVLGLLAVTAIPKFIDLTEQAKQANIEGMAGGFATAVSLVRAQWEAEGRPTNGGRNEVNYDGTALVLTTENTADGVRPGYVVGVVNIANANDGAQLGAGFDANNCVAVWANILQQPPSLTATFNNLNQAAGASIDYFVSKSGAGADSICHYYLKESLDRDGNNDFTNPNNSTQVGNSFTYQPSTSEVVIHINNAN